MVFFMKMNMTRLRQDIFGGLTSAVVALPLALAFGVASGLGPTAGLYGAIVLGFVAAALGGTPVQISGPTGPMTVVMAGIVMKFGGAPEIIFMIIILCGIIQALFGVFKLGAYVNYVPLPVISGFMTGIGCIIILMELLPVLGDYSAHHGLIGSMEAIPAALGNLDKSSLLLGGITFLMTLTVPARLKTYIPASLLALIVGTLIGVFYFPALKTIGDIHTGVPHIMSIALPLSQMPGIITAAFMLALLGSIDTLLTATVADKLTKTSHRSNKELIGQGIGNALVGFIGGIPGAGATMRTVVNINAGGKTRLSGMLHAVILMVLVTLLGDVAERIPQAVLAGLLLKVGLDIIDWGFLKNIRIYPKDKIFLMFAVLLLTVFSDLVTAIGLGLILSHMIYSRKMRNSQLSQIQYFERDDAIEMEDGTNNSITIKLSGHLSFAVVKDLMTHINDSLAKYDRIHLNFMDIESVDLSITSALTDVLKTVPDTKAISIEIEQNDTCDMFRLMGLFAHIKPENIQIR